MIESFCIVLMTNNLSSQYDFYMNVLNLKMLFDHGDVIGLGIDSNLCLILRQNDNSDSHHKKENKGPIIMTFRTGIENKNIILNHLKEGQYTIRSSLYQNEFGSEYHFIEDADGNEICLDFTLNKQV